MKTTICDRCGKNMDEDADTFLALRAYSNPKQVEVFSAFNIGGGSEHNWDFCSAKCLQEHVAEFIEKEG